VSGGGGPLALGAGECLSTFKTPSNHQKGHYLLSKSLALCQQKAIMPMKILDTVWPIHYVYIQFV